MINLVVDAIMTLVIKDIGESLVMMVVVVIMIVMIMIVMIGMRDVVLHLMAATKGLLRKLQWYSLNER